MKVIVDIGSSELTSIVAAWLAGGNPSACLKAILAGFVQRNDTPGVRSEDRTFNATVAVALADLVCRVQKAETLYYAEAYECVGGSAGLRDLQKEALGMIEGSH